MTNTINSQSYRAGLGAYPTGVSVVAACREGGRNVGMAVGSFTSVSLDPPLIAFFPAKTSATWPQIHAAGQFCVNVLAEDQEWVCRRFAASGEDKFSEVAHSIEGGSPRIAGAVAWIDCVFEQVHEAGDHLIVVGRVRSLEAREGVLPLVFLRGRYGGVKFATAMETVGSCADVDAETIQKSV